MTTPFVFKTVALIGRKGEPALADILAKLAARIAQDGFQVVLERDTAQDLGMIVSKAPYKILTLSEIGKEADVAIVLGGDGTMLAVGRELARYDVPLIGVHAGKLGFMTDIPLSEMREVIPKMLAGAYEWETRRLLEAQIIRAGRSIYSALALNDVVVSRSSISGMIELSVEVNGCFMYNQRSDGLIVATPTGSTAYALSVQGPILHPGLSGMVLVPIAPHALSNRPIVLPDDVEIAIQIASGEGVNVNFDMQSFTALQVADTIKVGRSAYTLPFLHPVGHSYYATLRKKLCWHDDTLLRSPRL